MGRGRGVVTHEGRGVTHATRDGEGLFRREILSHTYIERESVGEGGGGAARSWMYKDQRVRIGQGLGQHPVGVFTYKERGISGGILAQSMGARN